MSRLFFCLSLVLLAGISHSAIIEDFEHGFPGGLLQWQCSGAPDYYCYYQVENGVLKLGEAADAPTKFQTPFTLPNGEWIGAWMKEEQTYYDHSMLELFNKQVNDAITIIRPIHLDGTFKFTVLTQPSYKTMEGSLCEPIQPKTWYFLRLRKNGSVLDAEVYNQNKELICYLYGFEPYNNVEVTHLRLLSDEATHYTYWDSVTLGSEIPDVGEEPPVIIEPPGDEVTYDFDVKISLTRTIRLTGLSKEYLEQAIRTVLEAFGFQVEILNSNEVI